MKYKFDPEGFIVFIFGGEIEEESNEERLNIVCQRTRLMKSWLGSVLETVRMRILSEGQRKWKAKAFSQNLRTLFKQQYLIDIR